MAPAALLPPEAITVAKAGLQIPGPARERFEKAGVDLSKGYPHYAPPPASVQEADAIRECDKVDFIDKGTLADPEKKALFSAAKEVRHLGSHIGTEIIGLQLKDLTDEQRNELALLIAERSVVFLRDQELSPQDQVDVTRYYGTIDLHPMLPRVPGYPELNVVWSETSALERPASFRTPIGTQNWHTDLVHYRSPAAITHIHMDTLPSVGGDTLWASGYAAYEKLSPEFRKMIDGKKVVVRSGYQWPDENDPNGPSTYVTREQPMVRVHPVTGWKSLFVNRAMCMRIVGLDMAESALILNYLYDVYEKNTDIQCRFHWTPKTSALWDNRITIHNASWDYEGTEPRHCTRIVSLGEKPFFDPNAPTRRQALGLAKEGIDY